MYKRLRVGITYDVKEDYGFFASDWKHTDFTTLAEVNYIKDIFESRGHSVYLIGNYEKLYKSLIDLSFPPVDIIFNIAEGINSRNREGWIPSLLEMNNIPYAGSDAYGLSLSLNKAHTKIIARYLGIRTPEFCLINCERDAFVATRHIESPWILKPNYEGSSSGVAYVTDAAEFVVQAKHLLDHFKQPILCESYIEGREANVAVLYDGPNTELIGVVEVVRRSGEPIHIFGAQDKQLHTCTKVNTSFSNEVNTEMVDSIIKLYKYMGCLDYGRGDFRVSSTGKVYFLEINPLPSLDEESGFAKCCTFNNRKIDIVLEQIIFNALSRHKKAYQ